MNKEIFKKSFIVEDKEYYYYSLKELATKLNIDLATLPVTIKILAENLLRSFDGENVTLKDIKALLDYKNNNSYAIPYTPARVLMQDFTGVPVIVDLAALRDAFRDLGGNPAEINPSIPVDLVIDHSVQVDTYATPSAYAYNTHKEMERNKERYEFLSWGSKAFQNFRVVPPGKGICHQVNIEYLASVVTLDNKNGENLVYPDTLVGTDSHTPMVNALCVLGWGVGGIEAEAVMLGEPISMLVPEVIGFKLTGQLKEGVNAGDLIYTITNILRKKGVVGQFVEFFGEGCLSLSIADKGTVANMTPECGSTCNLFAVDEQTLQYLNFTGRPPAHVKLVEEYSKIQGLWVDVEGKTEFSEVIELDLEEVETVLAGPRRPHDKVLLPNVAENFSKLAEEVKEVTLEEGYELRDGSVVIAAITSCLSTSNPYLIIGAALLAKKACEAGLKTKPWVKTSLAPGSKVVTDYLEKAGLQAYLDQLGFNLVGYGCTTCIGNSGPLRLEIEKAITQNNLTAVSVISSNRNYEGRVHPKVKANYLTSPSLVVAYAIKGVIDKDMVSEPLGYNESEEPVFLKDIWPKNQEITDTITKVVERDMYINKYSAIFEGNEEWNKITPEFSISFPWKESSTYIRRPPYFKTINKSHVVNDIKDARILAILGDSITTDHISPAGSIAPLSPAAKYLKAHQIEPLDFNSYGSRRGNHQVMIRGTFANVRIRNEMLQDVEGGYTLYIPTGEILPIYEAAMRYVHDGIPLVIVAGKEYGTGSSRDWAAKGTNLLGVKAVIAESFERIHRSNLVGMGVLPLVFEPGVTRKTLNLTGKEHISIKGLENLSPKGSIEAVITRSIGERESIKLICRIDTKKELDYFKSGGILQYVLLKAVQRAGLEILL